LNTHFLDGFANLGPRLAQFRPNLAEPTIDLFANFGRWSRLSLRRRLASSSQADQCDGYQDNNSSHKCLSFKTSCSPTTAEYWTTIASDAPVQGKKIERFCKSVPFVLASAIRT